MLHLEGSAIVESDKCTGAVQRALMAFKAGAPRADKKGKGNRPIA